MTRRKGPTKPSRTWGPWYVDPRSPLPDGTVIVGNSLFTVHITFLDPDAKMDGPLSLAIHDKHRTTRHDWREFQRVKNEVCGAEREAVELYPAESRLVDTANEYHLWVAAEGEKLEVGFKERAVADSGVSVDTSDPRVIAAAEGLGIPLEGLNEQLSKARQRKIRTS